MPKAPGPLKVYGLVAFALLCVSASAILIRFAHAPALTVAFWRNAIALAFFAPLALVSKKPENTTQMTTRDRTQAIVAGLFLGAHFAFWISSLSYTTVAESVVLVCTQPIFVALLGKIFLKEKLPRRRMLGIFIASIGTLCIALYSSNLTPLANAGLGRLLALLGALTVAVYVLIGRHQRQRATPLMHYVAHVYGAAAGILLCICVVTKTPLFNLSPSSWFFIFTIALFPQIIGHTLFNWSLKYLPAAVLSSTILVEPVISTILAMVFLSEVPTFTTLVASVIILIGLAFVVLSKDDDKNAS